MASYDVHQHLWPPALVDVLRDRSEPPRLRGDVLELAEGSFPIDLRDHELERRLGLLDRDGIDVAVVSLPPTLEWETHAELADAYHEGIRELSTASGGRLLPLACGVCRDGFAGACVSAAATVAGLGQLPEQLERSGQILFVHPGTPGPAGLQDAPPWWTAVVSYTAQMQAAYLAWLAAGAERRPDLPVVFAILAGGAAIQVERLRSRAAAVENRPNLYFDTASYGRRALELSLETYGVGQLVYGSDVPVIDSRPTLHAVAGLGDAAQGALLSRNPSRLFG